MSVISTPTGYTVRYDAVASGFAFSGMQMIPSFSNKEDYFIWVSGSTYRALNTRNGIIEQSGTDYSTVIQTVLDQKSGTGVSVRHAEGTFTVETPISIPKNNGILYEIYGASPATRSQAGTTTTLIAGSSFPTSGRYIFEHIGSVADGSAGRSKVHIRDFVFTNVTHFATKRVGGIRYESDGNTVAFPVLLERLQFNLISGPIHIIGFIYGGHIEDIDISTSTTTFSGQFGLRMERDYFGWENAASGNTAHTDIPKIWHISNFRLGDAGYIENGILVEGGYNHFYDINIDGHSYDRPFIFRGHSWSNKVYGLRMQDLNAAPPGSGHVASLVFDASGTGVSGFGVVNNTYQYSSGGTAFSCYDNKVFDLMAPQYPATVAFLGSGHRNYVECEVFGGTTISVNDLNAGPRNQVVLREGQLVNTSVNTTAVYSGARIILDDQRTGASTRGLYLDSGNASKTLYTIPHRLFANPMSSGYVNIQAASKQARASGGLDISGDATNIYVTFGAAPASGNVSLMWEANVYPR